MFTLDTVAWNRTGGMSRLTAALNILTLVKRAHTIMLSSKLLRLRYNLHSVSWGHDTWRPTARKMGATFNGLSSVGPRQKVSYNRPTRITSYPPWTSSHACQVIGYLARPMLSFRLYNESDKCMQRSKRSWVLRCALLGYDVSSTKYIGREGESGMVCRRAAGGTPLTGLPSWNPFWYVGSGPG